MKWGKKNSPSSSSSTTAGGISSISRVFPVSWLSKIKQMSGNTKSLPTKTKQQQQKLKLNSSPLYDEQVIDDEAYWRFSFGKESFQGKKKSNSLCHDSDVAYDDDEVHQLPLSNFRSCSRSTTKSMRSREDTQSFNNMVSDIQKMRELSEKDREEIVVETLRRKIQKGRKISIRKSRRTDRRHHLDEIYSDSGRDSIIKVNRRRRSKAEELEKDVLNLEPIKTIETVTNSNSRKSHYISSSNSMELRGRSIDEGNQDITGLNLNRPNRLSEEIDELDRKTEKESKVKDLMLKSEKQRRSFNNRNSDDEQKRRTNQNSSRSKVKVYSPRTPSKVEFIKIRAIEEMKKAKLKKKKKKEMEMEMEGRRASDLERFAMVKCSYDPQNDFKESMVEMIIEKQIKRPEELEELLACYLTLNSDEYHDLIIKVFKQIWFDLNQSSFSPESQIQEDHSYSVDYY